MSRQRAFTQSQLLDATEQLLLERGYDGFQLKELSSRLPGARSTIYEYYANKEEIVSACMRRTMDQMLEECEGVEKKEPYAALQEILYIFMKCSAFHQLMTFAPRLGEVQSTKAAADLEFLDEGHAALKAKLMIIFSRAQEEGVVRSDVPLTAIVATFYNLVDTPNWQNVPTREWSDMLFSLWLKGAGK